MEKKCKTCLCFSCAEHQCAIHNHCSPLLTRGQRECIPEDKCKYWLDSIEYAELEKEIEKENTG